MQSDWGTQRGVDPGARTRRKHAIPLAHVEENMRGNYLDRVQDNNSLNSRRQRFAQGTCRQTGSTLPRFIWNTTRERARSNKPHVEAIGGASSLHSYRAWINITYVYTRVLTTCPSLCYMVWGRSNTYTVLRYSGGVRDK